MLINLSGVFIRLVEVVFAENLVRKCYLLANVVLDIGVPRLDMLVSFQEQSGVDVDFNIFLASKHLLLLLFGLLACLYSQNRVLLIDNILLLSCCHELFEVQLIGFGHLGRLLEGALIRCEVGILANNVAVLAFGVLIRPRVLQILRLHGSLLDLDRYIVGYRSSSLARRRIRTGHL